MLDSIVKFVSNPISFAGFAGIVGIGIVLRLLTWHRAAPEVVTPSYTGRNRRNPPILGSASEYRGRDRRRSSR